MKDINILKNNNIDIESGIEILGDIDTYNEILNDFLEETEERLKKLEEYKNNNDLEDYAILVHALKGDSKYLGFTHLATLAEQHQFKSEENNLEYINNNYDELIEELKRIINITKEYLEN